MNKRILTISAKNLKGQEFREPLAPLTLISGLNGTGKTARLDAITLAATGRLPGLPQTNAGVFSLASASPLIVEMTVGDGQGVPAMFSRSWTKGRGVSVTGKADTPDGITLDPVLFNPGAFFSASPRDRAAMIRQRIGGDEAAMIAALVGKMREYPVAIAVKPKEAGDFEAFADAWGEAIKAKLSESTGYAKKATGTLQTLAGLATESGVAVELDEVVQAEREARSAETALEEAIRQRDQFVDGLLSNLDTWTANRMAPDLQQAGTDERTAKQALAAFEMNYKALESAWERYNTANAELERMEARLDDTLQTVAEYNATITQLQGAAITAEAVNAPGYDPATYDRTAQDLAGRIARGKLALEQAQASLAEGSTCPHCGAQADHWGADKLRDLTATVESAPAAIAELESQLQSLQAAKTVSEANAALRRKQQAEIADLVNLRARAEHMDGLRVDIEAAKARMPAQPGNSLEEEAAHLQDLEREVEEAKEALESAQLRTATETLFLAALGVERLSHTPEELRAALEAIRADNSAIVSLREALERSQGNAASLRAAYKQGEQARANASQRAQVEAELATAEKEVAELKPASEALQASANAITAELLGPVLHEAQWFTDGLIPSRLTNRGLDLGRWDSVTWIPLATFSESEKMICVAGIVAALAARSDCKLAILDECNRIDSQRRELFVQRIHAGIKEGRLSQAILVANTPWSYPEADIVSKLEL